MKFAKIWGTTEKLLNINNVEIHRIEVKPKGFCSKHFHRYKYNYFFVEKGALAILIYKQNTEDKTILKSGDSTLVPPTEYHLFYALEPTIAYEIYYVELKEEDIVREFCGGTNFESKKIIS